MRKISYAGYRFPPEVLARQFQSGVLVALGLNQHIEDLGVDGAPQKCHPPIDLQIDFDAKSRAASGGAYAIALQSLVRNDSPSGVRFVGDRDPALSEQTSSRS